jgi:phage terminase large subunit-like protein
VPVYGGLDLSEVSDLTALVLIGWRDRKWRVQSTFWLPSEGLAEKAMADRVPYDLWRAQGYLQATPGKTVSYEFVANHLCQVFKATTFKSLRSIAGTCVICCRGFSERASASRL